MFKSMTKDHKKELYKLILIGLASLGLPLRQAISTMILVILIGVCF